MNKEIQKILRALKKKKNVIGGSRSIQLRERGGETIPGTSVLRIYVTKKEALSDLNSKDVLPEVVEINGKKYEVDVVEVGKLKAIQEDDPDPKKEHRPLVMGISTNNARSQGACTLGTFAKDLLTNQVVQLSNQHCFGMQNDANMGDWILQPSWRDGGTRTRAHKTGEFIRGVELKFNNFTCPYRNSVHGVYRAFSGEAVNRVDVSCASLEVPYEMKVVNGVAIPHWRDPVFEARPWAFGRSSGYSYDGEYIDMDGYVEVDFKRGKASFVDVVIGKQSDTFKCIEGDSGSPWFEDDYLIGLRFSMSDTTWTGCKWSNIMKELQVGFLS